MASQIEFELDGFTTAKPARKTRTPKTANKAGFTLSRHPLRKCKGKTHYRRIALAIGGIGSGLLALSVVHCTEAISLLTGSHWALAGLLAIGIDAGMVASEAAELASEGRKGSEQVKRWARGYTIGACLLSVVLNCYAFSLHAASGMVWAALLLGAAIPSLVYALGRISGSLWLASE